VRSTPCMWRRGAWVSWLSLKTKVDGLLVVWSQNHWDGFAGLVSKPVATVFSSLPSKLVATVSSGLASKPAATVFSSLTSKLLAMVSPSLASKSVVGFLVEPQIQGGGGFLGLGLKICSSGLVIWASKSP
jgi:hypothetical protein